jgi:hypothetical protein
VVYVLYLRLDKGENFDGVVEINFKLQNKNHKELLVDFRGEKFNYILLNNKLLKNYKYDGLFLHINT